MGSPRPEPLGWLTEYSELALRSGLRGAAPELADLPISLQGMPDLSNPLWASGTAILDGWLLAKFAFSEPTAVRLWREAQALELLGDGLALSVPKLVAASRSPALLATELLSGGAPLTYETVSAALPDRIEPLAIQIAHFLSRLHASETLALARERLDCLLRPPEPGFHISTEDLRARFMELIKPHQRSIVSRWCDWVDEQLAVSAETVLVHGDFHPYNQLWDLDEPRLLAVLDFESSRLAEPEFDFRVLPVFGPGVALLVSTVERYQAISGRKLSLPRIMALHLLNYLGDALWRTEAGIDLHEPGDTPTDYVTEAAGRFAALGIDA